MKNLKIAFVALLCLSVTMFSCEKTSLENPNDQTIASSEITDYAFLATTDTSTNTPKKNTNYPNCRIRFTKYYYSIC